MVSSSSKPTGPTARASSRKPTDTLRKAGRPGVGSYSRSGSSHLSGVAVGSSRSGSASAAVRPHASRPGSSAAPLSLGVPLPLLLQLLLLALEQQGVDIPRGLLPQRHIGGGPQLQIREPLAPLLVIGPTLGL